MFFDGYKYWLAYTKNATSYYRCSRHSGRHQQCPGRCVRQRNGTMRATHAHSHGPDHDRLLVDAFRAALTQRAGREPQTDLHTIYWDEASQRHLDAAMLYGFGLAESAMRKARLRRQARNDREQQLQPGVYEPTNAMEVDAVLAAGGGVRALRVGGQGGTGEDSGGADGGAGGGGVIESFYRCTLKMTDGTSCWVFAHGNTLRRLRLVEQLHVDASMVDVIVGYSLMVFHAVQTAGSTPIVYAVFSSRSPAAAIYAAVFAYVREQFATHIRPTQLVTNYAPCMQKTAQRTYPDATVKGFWHEYTGALLARIRNQQPPALQTETASGHGCSCLRMLLVLPLLPADYMTPGLEAVRRWATDKRLLSPAMQELCTYVAAQWLRPMGAGKISMFGVPAAVHSHAQHFVKELHDQMAGAADGSGGAIGVWQLLRIVAQMATRAWSLLRRRDRLQRGRSRGAAAAAATAIVSSSSSAMATKDAAQGGGVVGPGPAGCNRIEKHRGTIITDATEQWIRTPVHLRNPLQFLQLSSHCANDLLYTAGLEAATRRDRAAVAGVVPQASVRSGGTSSSSSIAPPQPPPQPSSSSSLACSNHLPDSVVDVSACSFDQLLQNDHNYFFDTTPAESNADDDESAAVVAEILYHHEPFQIIPPQQPTMSMSGVGGGPVVESQSVFELCSEDVTHLFGAPIDDAGADDAVDLLTAAVRYNFTDTGNSSSRTVVTAAVPQQQTTCQLLAPLHPPPTLVTMATTTSTSAIGGSLRRVVSNAGTTPIHSSSEPPPLKFFKTRSERATTTTAGMMSGPPPLVPIRRRGVAAVLKRKTNN